jgi:phage-related protein
MDKQFNINGKTYNNLNDLPPEFRQWFEDKNNNGVPDMFEGMIGTNTTMQGSTQMNSVVYNHNGKTYSSLNEMPPEVRAEVEKKLNAISKRFKIIGGETFGKGFNHSHNPATSFQNPVGKSQPLFGAGAIFMMIVIFVLMAVIAGLVYLYVL